MGDDRIDVPGDDGVPNVARIYDYVLGGAHNFAADRERAEQLMAARPGVVVASRANRHFLRHAVDHAVDLGVRQFLDLGSGIPTVGNVHEVAGQRDPGARVAYVDHEPVAFAHSTAILAETPNATITCADLRDPDVVLAAPEVADLLDFDQPIALLVLAALHFVLDEQGPGGILAAYRFALPPGSLLALTHGSDDYPEHPELVRDAREVTDLFASTSNPVRMRSRDEILRIVAMAGFAPDADGLVELRRWAVPPQEEPVGAYAVISEPLR